MLSSFLAEVRVALRAYVMSARVPTLIAASFQLKAERTEHVMAMHRSEIVSGLASVTTACILGIGLASPRELVARVSWNTIGRGVHEVAAVDPCEM